MYSYRQLFRVEGVETEEEADPILQLLLDSSRTPRKRKQDSQEMANVQYTYINEQ